MKPILVHVHIYYTDMWEELKSHINNIAAPYNLHVTLVAENPPLQRDIMEFKPDAHIQIVENRGFDLGPFIHVLNQVNLDDYSYLIKLHSKRNKPPKSIVVRRDYSGKLWRKYCLSFLDKGNFSKCLAAFEADPQLGMAGHFHLTFDREYADHLAREESKLLLEKLGLPVGEIGYVAGTMFMVRAGLFKKVQQLGLSIEDFDITDPSKVTSLAHSMERFLGWVVKAQGYNLADPYTPRLTRIRMKTRSFLRRFETMPKFKTRRTASGKIRFIISDATVFSLPPFSSIFHTKKSSSGKLRVKVFGVTILSLPPFSSIFRTRRSSAGKLQVKVFNITILSIKAKKGKHGKVAKDIMPIQSESGKKIIVFETCPESFVLPKSNNPKVSIIIPVYNQYNYTKLCLWAILNHTEDVEYEVIIGDDCSTDETADIQANIENLVYIKNKENLKFLLNCNNAAKSAKGEYLLFLNNDTQVQPDWLSSLVRLIESDKKIGMVGSKLVFPNGELQEAGGIIWKDASGCNYGRDKSINNNDTDYVKEVDYISGASIMLSKKLWNELDGFDREFMPAYYEDTDLAFRIRNDKNLKVVYQPTSVVVHFEGVSHGKDLAVGIKAYQVENARKFYQRWKDVLEKKHCDPCDSFYAKDRSMNKKTLLFMERGLLTYDKDAGSRVSFQYLKFFVDSGLNVKFLPLNRDIDEKYLTAIQQLGVEVLIYFADGAHSLAWIEDHARYIDYVYLNRPEVADFYLETLKTKTSAKIIYQGHDLHFLRERRRYDLLGDVKALEGSEWIKKIETNAINNVDVVTMFSNAEIAEVKKLNPSVEADTVPLFILDVKQKAHITYNPAERSGIIFVGGFRHQPNSDAVTWFAENVFPEIKRQIPDIKFFIVGSEPTPEVMALADADSNIIIKGFIPDAQLDELYSQVKLAVVPLRFGAGIKGKVVEAVYNKIPVITTNIGAEGIDNKDGLIEVADSAQAMAASVIELYTDDKSLIDKVHKSEHFIETFYSKAVVQNKFKQWMDI